MSGQSDNGEAQRLLRRLFVCAGIGSDGGTDCAA
jgi:hypothetical protein